VEGAGEAAAVDAAQVGRRAGPGIQQGMRSTFRTCRQGAGMLASSRDLSWPGVRC
jgi:hypothetical protein